MRHTDAPPARRPIPILLALLLAFAAAPALHAQAAPNPPLWGRLQPGAYGVGFRVIETRDETRAGPDGTPGRPLRVAAWYPAAPGAPGEALTLARYASRIEGIDDATEAARRALGYPGEPLAPRRLQALASARLRGVEGAPPAAGPFPVVVVGTGLSYESPLTQAVLAEYLASHGYVVVSARLMGSRMALAEATGTDVEAQARDLEALAAEGRKLPGADPGALAVVGFDLGGMAAMAMAMRRPDVDAVASWDSGVLSARLLPDVLRRVAGYDPRSLRAPLLLATRTSAENQARGLAEDLAVLDSAAYAPRHLLRIGGMRHADFSLYAMAEAVVPELWGRVEGSPRAGHEALLFFTRSFLDAYVRNVPEARAFLAGAHGSEAAPNALTFETRPASPAPPAREEVAALLMAGNAAGARALLQPLGPAASTVADEVLFARVGNELLARGTAPAAIAVFQLGGELYPASTFIQQSLARAYLVTGDRARALALLQTLLERDPNDAATLQMLRAANAP